MRELFREKMNGMEESVSALVSKTKRLSMETSAKDALDKSLTTAMKEEGYDDVRVDGAGNLIGEMKSGRDEGDVVVLVKADLSGGHSTPSYGTAFSSQVATGLFAGALVKKTLSATKGNTLFAVVPRFDGSEFAAEYLFNETLKSRKSKIKGVVLCEPTGFNVGLGHKGKMEYEIEVSGDFVQSNGGSRIQLTFPLISELAKVGESLPSDTNLGRSKLSVRDVSFTKVLPGEPKNGVKLTVDRVYIPQEERGAILSRAKSIAEGVYSGHGNILVNTAVATERVRVASGMEFMLDKKSDPWLMDPRDKFVLDGFDALSDSGLKPQVYYWKETFTLGSLTCAKLKLPTFGFGPGLEGSTEDAGMEDILKAVYGAAWVIHRAIGVPSFGWTSDDI